MADELIALFGKITTNDHDELVEQFAKILHTEREIATFFLEASSWNVQVAVHNYLASVGSGAVDISVSSPPQAMFLGDLSPLQNVIYAPNKRLSLNIGFRNIGRSSWPHDTCLSFVDGHRMGGPQMVPLVAAPGCDAGIVLDLITPEEQGTHMGCWRLVCSAGYFGESLYIIVAVASESNTNRYGDVEELAMQMSNMETQENISTRNNNLGVPGLGFSNPQEYNLVEPNSGIGFLGSNGYFPQNDYGPDANNEEDNSMCDL